LTNKIFSYINYKVIKVNEQKETREFFLSKIKGVEYANGRLNVTFFGQSGGSIGPATPNDVNKYPPGTLVVRMSRNNLKGNSFVGIVKPKTKRFVDEIINGDSRRYWRLPDYRDKIYVDL